MARKRLRSLAETGDANLKAERVPSLGPEVFLSLLREA